MSEFTDLTEAVCAIALNSEKIANAITPLSAAPGHDETGGHVESLTEAVMGVTGGLVQIASAIHDLADAVRERETPR